MCGGQENLENTPTPLYEEPGVIHGHITVKAHMALGDNYSKAHS